MPRAELRPEVRGYCQTSACERRGRVSLLERSLARCGDDANETVLDVLSSGWVGGEGIHVGSGKGVDLLRISRCDQEQHVCTSEYRQLVRLQWQKVNASRRKRRERKRTFLSIPVFRLLKVMFRRLLSLM